MARRYGLYGDYDNRPYGALNQLVTGFTEGYDNMSRWVREHREEKDKERKRKTRDRIAEIGEALNTGGYDRTTAIPAGRVQNFTGTDHPGRTTTHATSARDITVRDWAQARADMLQAYMQSGDMAGAVAADDGMNRLQQRGAMQYAGQALSQLQAGDIEGAAQALNQANQYFPNGSRSVYDVIGGRLVMMGIDEETGKPRGDPVMVTPEYIQNVVANMQDIDKFLAFTKDRQMMELRAEEVGIKREDLKSMKQYRIDMADASKRRADAAFASARTKGANDLRNRQDKVYGNALKLYENLGEEDLAFMQEKGITALAFATMMAGAAGDNINASEAELAELVLNEIRRGPADASGQAGGTGTPPPAVPRTAPSGPGVTPSPQGPMVTAIPGEPPLPLPQPMTPTRPAIPAQPTRGGEAPPGRPDIPSLIPNPQRPAEAAGPPVRARDEQLLQDLQARLAQIPESQPGQREYLQRLIREHMEYMAGVYPSSRRSPGWR